ncbi:MAG: O-methyltransferase [Muribaculaceae bacterium]|nr:O-methyltransferase [Muribaculaceae bacterium]
MDSALDDYITAHISPEPDHLQRLYRHTHLYNLYPRMCSGHHQGRILAMLASMIKPRVALELGTFTGYSALCLAEGMEPGTTLHTVEINDEMEDGLLNLFATSPTGGTDIILHIGDALDIIPTLDVEAIDLVYIDANKRHYTRYLDLLLPRLHDGAFIIADNTLWDGKVLDPVANDDPQTAAIVDFNNMVARHPRLETVILPLRDGLTLMRVNG